MSERYVDGGGNIPVKVSALDPQSVSDELRGALEDCDKILGFIAEHYILSLSDFRYLINVSTQIRTALSLTSQDRGRP